MPDIWMWPGRSLPEPGEVLALRGATLFPAELHYARARRRRRPVRFILAGGRIPG